MHSCHQKLGQASNPPLDYQTEEMSSSDKMPPFFSLLPSPSAHWWHHFMVFHFSSPKILLFAPSPLQLLEVELDGQVARSWGHQRGGLVPDQVSSCSSAVQGWGVWALRGLPVLLAGLPILSTLLADLLLVLKSLSTVQAHQHLLTISCCSSFQSSTVSYGCSRCKQQHWRCRGQHHVRERGLSVETNMQSTDDANESGCNRERKEASERICQGLIW